MRGTIHLEARPIFIERKHMSDDLLLIVRRKQHNELNERYYYSRHGASYLHDLLLEGQEATLEYILQQQETQESPEPITWSFMYGALLVDCEKQFLLYWSDQFYTHAFWHRYYRLLLQQQWPHWEVRWAYRAINDFADALGRTFPEQQKGEQQLQKIDYQWFIDEQDEQWHAFQKQYENRPEELAALIHEYGEELLRHCDLIDAGIWVTARRTDGAVADYLLSDMGESWVLRVGPDLLHYLDQRKALIHFEEYVAEAGVKQCVFVDEATHEVSWWKGMPYWVDEGFWCAKLWEGWRVSQHDGGPRRQLQLSNRPLDLIRYSPNEVFEWACQHLAHHFLGTEIWIGERQKLVVHLIKQLVKKEAMQAVPEAALQFASARGYPDAFARALYALLETYR